MTDWDQVVSEHSRTVFRIAYRILGSVQDAEDVAQDVFTAAFEFQEKEPIRHWRGFLQRLATVRAIDRLRRNHPTVLLEDTQAAAHHDPFEKFAAQELAARLRATIGQLAPQQAAVFAMTHFEGMSRSEI